MIGRPWQKGDFDRIEIQESQQYLYSVFDMSRDLTEYANKGMAMTIEHDGQILLIGGLFEEWQGRALLWAIVSKHAGPHFPAIHKAVKRYVNNAPFRRIEATVDVGFEEGHRWIKMLGFELEGYMRAYRPDGEDMILYARVK